MCMINEMKRRIEELETERNNALAEVERLEARVARLEGIAKDMINAQYIAIDNLIGEWEEDDMDDAKDDVHYAEQVLNETPEQSIAAIQARAVDEFAGTYLAHVKGLDSVSVQGLRQSLVVYSNQILYREKDRLIANPTENN